MPMTMITVIIIHRTKQEKNLKSTFELKYIGGKYYNSRGLALRFLIFRNILFILLC